MTHDEFERFTTRLFVAFPDIFQWLKINSPNPAETLKVWEQILSKCTLEQCLLITSEWIEGKREPPTWREYQSTALIIRARINFDLDEERKRTSTHREAKTYVEHQREAAKRRNNYQAINFGESFHAANAVRMKHVDGKITADEMEREVDRIVSEIK